MASRARRRDLIPDGEQITAVLSDPKIVQGRFGRQLEAKVRVKHGQYRGTEFPAWFSFSKDKDTEEEYILIGGPLWDVLGMVEPNLDEVLGDDDLTEKKYQQFLKDTTKKLDGLEIQARVGVKTAKDNPEKKRNFLEPGTVGQARDPEELTANL